MVSFAAVSIFLAALGSLTACADVPGCKSTRTELLPGRMVRWESPATTSTSSGGSAVRMVVTGATGGDVTGRESAQLLATWCFGSVLRPCWRVTGFAATAEGSRGAFLGGNALDRLVGFGFRSVGKPEIAIMPEHDAQRQQKQTERPDHQSPLLDPGVLRATRLTESARSVLVSGFFAMVFRR